MRSDDAKHGWGPANGFLYQKAYFEFLIHPSMIKPLISYLEDFEDITYQAINIDGENYQNIELCCDVNAVTWGVFRGREIIQPTVVDHQAFIIWKDECLKTLSETWAPIYKPTKDKEGNMVGGDGDSIAFLQHCHKSFFLVNVVDNNYISGDLSKTITDFINDH